jgi:2-polyprenyl-6-methoxyphenol hydroxylase-like FAD-dependent oxidoreductase
MSDVSTGRAVLGSPPSGIGARPENEVHAFFRADGVPLICFPMRGHTWRLVLPFAGDRAPGPPGLGEIQDLVDQRAAERVTASDPTWPASFNCHRRSTNVYRRGHVLLAGDAVHIHTPAGGQGMNTGITERPSASARCTGVRSALDPGQCRLSRQRSHQARPGPWQA